MGNTESRRLKYFPIGDQIFFRILMSFNSDADYVTYLEPNFQAANLPPEVKVVGVHQDIRNCRTMFLLEHPSFDEVPLGMQIPEIETWGMCVHLRQIKKAIGSADDVQKDVEINTLKRWLSDALKELEKHNNDALYETPKFFVMNARDAIGE